ncbi:hypothetical protein VPH35_125948 [Triticum aestivum]
MRQKNLNVRPPTAPLKIKDYKTYITDGRFGAWVRLDHGPAAYFCLNARLVAEFGYLKNLPEILHRIIQGEVPELARREKKRTRKARVAASQRRDLEEAAQATVERRKKRADAAATAVQRYARDQNYRLLHDMTAEVFADLLAEDMKKLTEGKINLSLAGKWCPSDMPDAHYAYRARERLSKEAYVPLRHALELPETFMSAGEWGKVLYTRVASVAMKNYKDHFIYHDQERFNGYLADVKSGKKKIAAGALPPHKILESAVDGEDEVADLQWKRMVDDLLALGKLNNCLAVCDVSGSMHGLCDEPWRHRVITFSAAPQLHRIRGETLSEKAEFICEMEWGMNTDFQAVFDQLLRVAVAGKVPPERMVKKVFVFSDMEFDEAVGDGLRGDHEEVRRGPQVVFWNLRASRSVPVTAEQKGVALVSGFSKNMLKLFLGGDYTPSPRAVMDKAISGPMYEKLVVFD